MQPPRPSRLWLAGSGSRAAPAFQRALPLPTRFEGSRLYESVTVTVALSKQGCNDAPACIEQHAHLFGRARWQGFHMSSMHARGVWLCSWSNLRPGPECATSRGSPLSTGWHHVDPLRITSLFRCERSPTWLRGECRKSSIGTGNSDQQPTAASVSYTVASTRRTSSGICPPLSPLTSGRLATLLSASAPLSCSARPTS